MSFCLRTNKSFFSLLGDSKILSLGEFDELKSHLFLVHCFDGFLDKKTDLYAGIWNKLHQIVVQQEMQNKAEIAVKMSRMWSSSDVIIGCFR